MAGHSHPPPGNKRPHAPHCYLQTSPRYFPYIPNPKVTRVLRTTMSWDLNLCTNWDRKILVPFHYLVAPDSQYSLPPPLPTTSSPTFPFSRLPTDIQLIIYESCDLPTLFHLMHTCSRTRGPCAKLFWSNNNTPSLREYWYHCPSYWLFDHGKHHHPIITHDLAFAHLVTRIELNLLRLEQHFAEDEVEVDWRETMSTVTKTKGFWEKVGRAFPSVKEVVLTGMLPRRALPPPEGELDRAYSVIETVVGLAPAGMVVRIAFDDGGVKPRCYTLWRVKGSAWSVLDDDWKPTRILLPSRKWASSPLGDFLTFTRRNTMLMLEGRGMDWLKIETYARYATGGVIHCPRLDCDAIFPDRNQWEAHVEATDHSRLGSKYGYEGEHMMELLVWKGTPQKEKDTFEARQKRIDAAYRQTRKLQRRVGCGWSEAGTEARRLFEEQFFAQLREENFAAPGQLFNGPDNPNCQWMDCLYMYYDPTHVYYAGE
jgi:hypothetical protein